MFTVFLKLNLSYFNNSQSKIIWLKKSSSTQHNQTIILKQNLKYITFIELNFHLPHEHESFNYKSKEFGHNNLKPQAPHLHMQLGFNNNYILIKLEKREKKKTGTKVLTTYKPMLGSQVKKAMTSCKNVFLT